MAINCNKNDIVSKYKENFFIYDIVMSGIVFLVSIPTKHTFVIVYIIANSNVLMLTLRIQSKFRALIWIFMKM